MRIATANRSTKETAICLDLNLDGSGKHEIDTGCGFLNHMLELFAAHGKFDLKVKCIGDTHVDDHHTVEDIGIALGRAFDEALGDRRGIYRYGEIVLPMDEALIQVAVDISGRDILCYGLDIPTEKVGSFDTQLVEEFMLGFTRNLKCALHVRQLAGTNSHHIIEGMFKALGRTLRKAVSIDSEYANEVPSTKGTIL